MSPYRKRRRRDEQADAEEPEDGPERLRPGTITRLTRQRRDVQRVNVFLDDAFALGLHEDIVVKAGLKKGLFLSAEALEQLRAEDARVRARRLALEYIAHRARTRAEVLRRLARAGFAEADAEAAADRMVELGYLDDEGYARAYVRGRAASRGHGPARLRADLLRRGVHRALIDRVIEEETESDELLESAQRVAEPRWARLQSEPDPRKRRKKLSDFLARRGFSFDTIRTVLEALERADDGG